MARSLSLAAYMAYARRASQLPNQTEVERPQGELIWAHAGDTGRAEALCQIAERLSILRPGLQMLLTLAVGIAPPRRETPNVVVQPLPEDTVVATKAFLHHWLPDLCLWAGADLRPALLNEADAREIPLYLIDADENQIDRPGWRWFPDLPRSLLKRFAQVQTRSDEGARALRRLGVPEADIIVTGPLRAEAMPLTCDEREREDMAQILLGRPIWLAAYLHEDELETVLEARRIVSRLSHRLILVIVPQVGQDPARFLDRIEAQNLRAIDWADGAMPTEITQVIVTASGESLGLWYRLAPICFMGGSLIQGMTGHDPNEPAVHGSAILYGPNVRNYLSEYSRFAETRAARIVRDAPTLAAAVSQLIAPDQAASMAHAAWDVASQGAEVTDRILDLVQETLDIVGRR